MQARTLRELFPVHVTFPSIFWIFTVLNCSLFFEIWSFFKNVVSFKTAWIIIFCAFFLIEEPELVCAIFRKKSKSHSRFTSLQDYVFGVHVGPILKSENWKNESMNKYEIWFRNGEIIIIIWAAVDNHDHHLCGWRKGRIVCKSWT